MRMIRGNVERIAGTSAQVAGLKAEGYRPVENIPENTAERAERDIGSMDTRSLRAFAKEKGLEGCSALNRAELLEVLKDVV